MSPNCSATGPINIVHTDKSCFNKCKLAYNFKKSEVSVFNRKTYLRLKLNDRDSVSAKFSSADTPHCLNGGESNFIIDEVRVYSPSLHTYGSNKSKAEAEVIIILSNITGGRHLIISIPITAQNGDLPQASEQLTSIITYMISTGNTKGEGGLVKGLNFDLNSFIPKNKGYYSYSASLPWDPCEKCTDYIVFDKKDSRISLNNFVISKLKKMVKEDIWIVVTGKNPDHLGYAYNKKGAKPNLGENDAIWINCYPTGADGKILVEESKSGILNNNSFGMFTGTDQKTFEKYMYFLKVFIISIICVVILFYLIFKLPSNLLTKIQPQGVGNK
tara:strand:+ start:407 stop:1396 length:990 start_codon:yes stop_codon:yes gene_type:complete